MIVEISDAHQYTKE